MIIKKTDNQDENNQLTFREIVKRFFEPVKYTRGAWWFFLFVNIFNAFKYIFIIQIGSFIIEAIENKDISNLHFWVLILMITFWVGYVFNYLYEIYWESSYWRINGRLRTKYLEEYLYLENTEIEKIGIQKLQSIIFEGVNKRSVLLRQTFISLLVEILAVMYAFVIIILYIPNWKYGLLFLFLFLFACILFGIGIFVMRKSRNIAHNIYLEMIRHSIKFLMSKFEVLQNNRLERELHKDHSFIQKQHKERTKGNTRKIVWRNIGYFLLDGARVGLYLFLGLGIIYGNYSIAYLVLLLQLLGLITDHSLNWSSYINSRYKDVVYVRKLWNVFDTIPHIDFFLSNKNFIPKNYDFSCTDISYSYEGDGSKKVFSSFSLLLDGGTKTALVGPSGGGKTTLIKLLAGYVFPQQGEILVDGQDLSKINLIDYYKHIGYLTQEPNVFDGTIRENLLYGIQYEYDEKDKKFQKKIEKIIQDSKCEFIYEFKDGLETEIGERGVRLSGGQKQRLAIAKIMLKNPNIILLDEPTSALDSVSEQKVSQALNNLFEGKTVIVVAHRLQTVKEADEIIVLQEGKVVERGTHESLKRKKGVYREMLDLQTSF